MTLPPLYDESDYEALRAEKDARIAALEHIIGRQEEELHQGELRIAELEAKLKWAMGLNACIEHERAEQTEAELAALKSAELSEHRLAREEAEAELATKEKECQEQFRQLLGAGETFNRMNAELAALKEDLKHLHSRWDYTQYWFANLYPVDWDRCQERYNTTKTGARAEEGGEE